MDENTESSGLDQEQVIVCRCEEISRGKIRAAIANGCDSVTWVKRTTRAGMGLCQGRTCGRQVARMIVEETGQHSGQVIPDTQRPPLRPIPLAILEEKGDNGTSTG